MHAITPNSCLQRGKSDKGPSQFPRNLLSLGTGSFPGPSRLDETHNPCAFLSPAPTFTPSRSRGAMNQSHSSPYPRFHQISQQAVHRILPQLHNSISISEQPLTFSHSQSQTILVCAVTPYSSSEMDHRAPCPDLWALLQALP